MNTIGNRIVYLREEQNISQKELAITIGITATTLSRYENNIYEPKAEMIKRLAATLHTSSDFLLGLTDLYEYNGEVHKIPEVSTHEYRILKYYNQLSETNKIRIDERILTLYETQK